MPSVSSKQAGFFGLAKALKSGKAPKGINPSVLSKAKKAAKMSEKTINKFLTINPAKALNGKTT